MAVFEDDLSLMVHELNSAAIAPKPDRQGLLDGFLKDAATQGATDVILAAGAAATFRVNGALASGVGRLLGADELKSMLLPLLNKDQASELEKSRAIDLCFARGTIGRFRANIHYQRGTLAASIRLLPAQVPTIESLHLPPVMAGLMERRQGLVLVTGPTGSGKTSTLAAMVDRINGRRRDHIITIEDPVEYQHANRMSIIEQIEVGRDTPSFAQAVRAVLRQNPDVILIGEMRDAETMAAAMTAAETGHLVLSTLHTNDAAQTMSRILDSFPSTSQAQIRQQLSLALLAVVAQQLIPGAAGLFPSVEVMVATTGVRNLIRTGQDHQLRSLISTGRNEGMMTMDQSLAELVKARRISRETAIAHCYHPEELRLNLERGAVNSCDGLGDKWISPSASDAEGAQCLPCAS